MRKEWAKPSRWWLLAAVPAAFLVHYVPAWQDDVTLFILSAIAIIPLASLIGEATEQLASRVGPGLGGLLNATFGNAAELIICIFGLSQGLVSVVKASIAGSIIGNILLVLGLSALAGGLKYERQKFNQTLVQASSTSLLLAAIALFTPTVFEISAQAPAAVNEQRLSLAIAIVLAVCYVCVLIFSLKRHEHHDGFTGVPHAEGESDVWSIRKAVSMLLGATVVTAFLSEFLVGSIEATRQALGLTETFVGMIIVAIVGNAAEHATAVIAARKNQMDLSISIALGSSLQIALFVAPVLVFVSYAFGKPMTLHFSAPELFAVVASVYICARISGDGETNWLEGVQLLTVYLILALLFFFLPAS